MKKLVLSLAVILSGSVVVYAQNNPTYERGATQLENILPPSPESSSAVKYVDVPFTHSMGVAELEVPLYTLQGRELSLPVSLRYRSGGIKLDEIAGVAGLGWSLEAGGCVTRTVVDMPDEFSAAGFSHQMPSGTLLTALESQTNNSTTLAYLRDVARHRKDSALDRFSYNVCGLGGTFVIKDDDTVFYLSGDGVAISFTRNAAGKIDSFTLTGPDGTVYVLSEKETGIHRGRLVPASPGGGQQDDWTATTAWYLTSVTSPSGMETASFTYQEGGTWTCDVCPTTKTATFVCNGVTTTGTIGSDSSTIQHRYQTKQLSSIVLSGFTAAFSYSSSTGYVNHSTTSNWDRYSNYPQRLTGLDISYEGTPLRHVDIGTGQDSADGRIVLNSLRYYAGGVLDDKWDFSYAHPSPIVGYTSGTVSRYSQDWYGYYNAEKEKPHALIPGTFPPVRISVCPYEMVYVGGTPTVSLEYGEADGAYSHYMSLVSADHDGALTEWEWEGSAVSFGGNTYCVGSRVKSITVKDNGLQTIRKRNFTYTLASARGPVVATPDMYLSVDASEGLSSGGFFQSPEYTWVLSLHETPVVEGPSIQNTRVYYGSVTEVDTDGVSQYGAETAYTYDTSYATPGGTSTIGRFPTDWEPTYSGSYAPLSISPWWGVREVYQESGPDAPPLLIRKDTFKRAKGITQQGESEEYYYPNLTRQSVLVDYRSTIVMTRYLAGDLRYGDMYHYPVWAQDYAGLQPERVVHTVYGGPDHTSTEYFLFASRSSLSVPIRVSRRVVESEGLRRCTDYLYPDTWPASSRPSWATQLGSRHSLVEPVKQTVGRLSSSGSLTGSLTAWLTAVTEYGNFSINGHSRLMFKKRTESVGSQTAWSEEVLSRDRLGNASSVKETGKPTTSILWSYNGLYPVAIAENATGSSMVTALGGQTAANALTMASAPTSAQIAVCEGLRTALTDAHVTTFTHSPGRGMMSQTSPAGTVNSYDRDGAGRLTAERDADGNAVKGYVYSLLNSGGHRSVRSRSYRTSSGNAYTEDIQWWSTLGLRQEEIAMGAGGGGEDLVTTYEGDYMLHDDVKIWQPYPVTASNGSFQEDAPSAAALYHGSSRAYTWKGYEESTRNLVLTTSLPGYNRVGQNALVTHGNWPLLEWRSTGVATIGQKTVLEVRTGDADQRRSYVFKDGEGRILGTGRGSFTALSGDPTYYIYDNHDRLRAVAGSGIALTDTLKMWRYGYDSKNRLSSKGIPGVAREGYGYDSENRLIRVRRPDGGIRKLHYDAMYRVDSVSYTPSGGTAFPLERHYYDSEPAFVGSLMAAAGESSQWSVSEKGLETGRKLAMLGSDGTVSGYALTVIRYDSKARPVCAVTQWPDSTLVKETFSYNFPGEVVSHVITCRHGADVDVLSVAHSYDIRGRGTNTSTTLSHNGVTVASDVTSYEYDALGRLSNTTSTAGGSSQSLSRTISYTLQDFPRTLSTQFGTDSLYVETLAHDDPDAVTGFSDVAASYSGFITGRKEQWPVTASSYSRSEGYGYDTSGRLTSVTRQEGTEQYNYDARGNVLTAPNKTYTYTGDRLTSLSTSGTGSGTFSFSYDTQGRMTSDGLSGNTISYNALDLPRKIQSSGGVDLVNYCYLSDGSKAEALKADGTGLVYRGSLIYRKAADGTLTLESVQIPGGRLTPGGVRYHVADHLGSVVAVVDGSTGALYQASEYAPYGERTDNAAVTVSSAPMGETFRDQFTGKEDQEPDFAVTYADFGARHYSPALGRWLVPDPLSEKYYDVSPYVYCDGNPIVLVDEWGLNPVYSLKGTFLGTDSNGLAGDYIIMNEDLFEQGMDNQEALKLAFIGPISTTILESINSHFSNLSKRPDYDGIVTIREGIDWAKAHVGALV